MAITEGDVMKLAVARGFTAPVTLSRYERLLREIEAAGGVERLLPEPVVAPEPKKKVPAKPTPKKRRKKS